MRKLTLIMMLVVFSAIYNFGQNIIATTDDGEKVILKPDSTWEYAIKPKVDPEKAITDEDDYERACEFAKNNLSKLKKSEFETEVQYKARLADFYSNLGASFKIEVSPTLLNYRAEEQAFIIRYFSSSGSIRLVERGIVSYIPADLEIIYRVSPEKAKTIKEKIKIVFHGLPVNYTDYGGSVRYLEFLPTTAEIQDRETGEIFFVQSISNFINISAKSDREDVFYSRPAANKTTPGTDIRVKGYRRKDGTYVRPHTRSKPRKRN